MLINVNLVYTIAIYFQYFTCTQHALHFLSCAIIRFMKRKIIVISGKQYCGKDTVARILLENLDDFKRIGIGDAIKIEYGKKNGLTFEQIEAQKHLYRNGLIELGNWGRGVHPDFWLKKILELEYSIIVPDARVCHEVEMFKAAGAFLLRVEATHRARELRGKITNENDLTETALDNFCGWNYVLDNNSDYESLKLACTPLILSIKNFFQ